MAVSGRVKLLPSWIKSEGEEEEAVVPLSPSGHDPTDLKTSTRSHLRDFTTFP
jgi:hypothetical protein